MGVFVKIDIKLWLFVFMCLRDGMLCYLRSIPQISSSCSLDQTSSPIPLKYACRQDTQTLKNRKCEASSLSISQSWTIKNLCCSLGQHMHNCIYDFCSQIFRQLLCMKDGLGYLHHNFIIALNESILLMDILRHTIFMHNLVICRKFIECPINIFSTFV